MQLPHRMWSPPGPSSQCWRAGQLGRTCPCWAEPRGNRPRWCCGPPQGSGSQTARDTPSWSAHTLEDTHTHTHTHICILLWIPNGPRTLCAQWRLFSAKHNDATVSVPLHCRSEHLPTKSPINPESVCMCVCVCSVSYSPAPINPTKQAHIAFSSHNYTLWSIFINLCFSCVIVTSKSSHSYSENSDPRALWH